MALPVAANHPPPRAKCGGRERIRGAASALIAPSRLFIFIILAGLLLIHTCHIRGVARNEPWETWAKKRALLCNGHPLPSHMEGHGVQFVECVQ